jgi:OOP family OmpA-OmpF porin
VELQGHTDNVGRKADNQLLSQRRAEAVQAYLIQQGVPASQLSARGYGDSEPIASNADSAGRALNRRTVFEVLQK